MPIHLRLRGESRLSQSGFSGDRTCCCSAVSSAQTGRPARAGGLAVACFAEGVAGFAGDADGPDCAGVVGCAVAAGWAAATLANANATRSHARRAITPPL